MLFSLKKRLTYANVAATLALVFAMTGGAYAAKHYIINSINQINPKVRKQLTGKTGKTGPAGPQGAPGTNGVNGKDGTPGTNGINGKDGAPGTNGKSIVSATEPKGAHCAEGGSNFEVEGAGTKTYACNGSPWVAGGVLPAGKSESGVWSALTAENGFKTAILANSAISFVIPLKSAPTVLYVTEEGGPVTHCSGTVAAPAADEGFVCVYAEAPSEAFATFEGATPYVSGAYLEFEKALASGFSLHGTWAVTGN